MATGISVGDARSGKRAYSHDLPLVPFIDFMICLIAFLIVTAVWTQASRLTASGKVPGLELGPSEPPPKELHVVSSTAGFELRWQQGSTVLERQHVGRVGVQVGGETRYPALSEAITQEWQAQGVHRAPTDPKLDRAVVHVPNDAPFSEIVAVLDALHAPRRGKVSAFDVAFSPN
jgi:biopolymer transport protein ExbD